MGEDSLNKKTLENKVLSLETKLNELTEKQKTLQATLKNPDATSTVKQHIMLLHKYNEIRDVALGLMGKIAEQEHCRLVDVMDRFGITKDD
ncbi:hypothetical protein T552_03209 [Pneumocystis carinii B80]|uniref:Swi5-domain-containing protein n=1 Tax=Pneumocystis carinii (strain B80) TaxID=1408658 RepID=A0A0W4ZBZ9_PNEC8|nr:hypothetical protein T552_03209 [Pneumocystis carinii B80]KTW25935.1 hypothetical protein T552_03209 [Pneumocystis carinii B80]